MAYFVKAIAVAIVVGSVVRGQKELEIEKDENIEPFSLLCRIYNEAKNPPINYVDLQEADKIVDEINSINVSFAEEKLANGTEDVENSTKNQLTPTITREATLAQLSLNQITQRAHSILEEIKKMKVTETIEKTKAEFSQVIFVDGGNESDLLDGALKGANGRAHACGDTGLTSKGNSAGKNLVVDFFCLCARRTDGEGVNKVCGFYLGSTSEHSQYGWDHNGPLGSSTMWASIKGGCGKHMQQHPRSTEEARHILDQFLKHLRTGGVYRWGNVKTIDGSDRKEGMLGTVVTTSKEAGLLCDGRKGNKDKTPGGICVYYGPDNWVNNIDWSRQLTTALLTVYALNDATASVQRNIQKLQMLLNRAEEIYETAKVISEVPSPAIVTAYKNASENLTTFNATRIRSYSHSLHHHTALWVLLLE